MVTGDNKNAVSQAAEYLAESFWNVKDEFEFVAPVASLDESLNLALKSKEIPYIISDMGDNPTAGGAGDVTWTLRELLKREEFINNNGPSVIYASIPGPELTKKAVEIGVGNEVEALVGAQIDNRYSPPIKIKGKITAIKHGDKYAETEVVVQCGSIKIIVTKKRKPYHKLSDFTELNINPNESDIIIVKIGYLVPELYNINKGWTMALTPGGVDQDLDRLDYKRIKRPMFPLDDFENKPDLSSKLIEISNKN